MNRASVLSAALLLAAPALLPAQAVPTRALARPDAEFAEPFSALTLGTVRELSNGKVIVADAREKTVQLVTFGGSAVAIGREGSGPGEYSLPMRVYAAPADTTWLWDIGNRRFLVIAPTGRVARSFVPETGEGAEGRMLAVGNFDGVDAQGRLYWRSMGFVMSDAGPVRSDSIPMVRWDPRRKVTDTLAWAPNPTQVEVSRPAGSGGGEEVRVMARVGGATPFGSAEAWAVAPDGRVARMLGTGYQVQWIAQGRRTTGPALAYDRVRVTDADRKAYMDARRNNPGISVTATNDGSGRQVTTANAVASAVNRQFADQPVTYPEFKGPFRPQGVAVAPDGRLWVERYTAFGTPTLYDVIDGTGKVVQRVTLPRGSRLVGFGAGGVIYAARADEDDLQYLQRFRM
jgi:hypothetical protein